MAGKISALLLALVMVFSFTACGEKADENGPTATESQTDTEETKTEKYGIHHAVIKFKDLGEVELELDGDTAPITVKNFVDLANEGFYDGLTIHRNVPGFVIQGGDPDGNGTGGSGKPIKGEFKANGIENNISHKRGVISMARLSNDMDSATSQFFIVLDDAAIPSLDNLYAGFGHVTKGMEIVDKIAAETPIEDPYSGSVAKDKQPVIESIKIID